MGAPFNFLALWRLFRPWVLGATFFAAVAVLSLVLSIKYGAECNLLTVFLSYLPAWIVALPLMGTLVFGLFFVCWRSILLSILVAFISVIWLGNYSFQWKSGIPAKKPGVVLSLMSYNRGQGSPSVMSAFAAENQPDVAVFQDAARRLNQIAALPEFLNHRFNYQIGEFVLLSRWPVLESEPLKVAWPEHGSGIYMVGARAVIDWNGRKIVIYNIHLPTPRDLLYWYGKRGTFLYGLLGVVPDTSFHKRHQQYLSAWNARVEIITQLLSRALLESEPVVLMGDWNFPPAGKAYQAVIKSFQDAHRMGGKGFGHTFPGNLKSLGKIAAPWIRIDHVFASRHWNVLFANVSLREGSQHLPIGAYLTIN